MVLDMDKLVKWDAHLRAAGSTGKDLQAIVGMHKEARSFLESFKWCTAVLDEYLGMAYPGIVGVFLFRIAPAREGVDEWVWVIVGDLPPAYITCEESPNPACALDAYIGAMNEWVVAASSGGSVDELIPVNVEPSKENAERLGLRLKFIDDKILSNFKNDLER
jgi:hypothetical protein